MLMAGDPYYMNGQSDDIVGNSAVASVSEWPWESLVEVHSQGIAPLVYTFSSLS